MAFHQRSLLALGEPGVDPSARFERLGLGGDTWVDTARGWCRGSDGLFDALVAAVPWRQGRRVMYERMLDDPRLSYHCAGRGDAPHPALPGLADALEARYGTAFGGPGCNWYRDGADSVAFHRDRELRELDDTLVAVLTLGGPRPFLLRPRGGGRSLDLAPGPGDLLVMGGACQRDWEHAVPKVARAVARISVTWRARVGTPAPPPAAAGQGRVVTRTPAKRSVS